jgi:8-oxo-dGTP pyrophosphatase MutT (NUDIX family)
MTPNKVCPVVLRKTDHVVEILAFAHPLAGNQLVKGTIEPGESIQDAALRELSEESGIEALINRDLGVWSSDFDNQVWAFVECAPIRICPDSWTHHAPDDGGHRRK